MRRREFIRLFGSTVVAWPHAARAQQPEQKRLIGVLMPYAESDSAVQSWLAAFGAALAKLGWSEGSNLRIELRWSAADPDKYGRNFSPNNRRGHSAPPPRSLIEAAPGVHPAKARRIAANIAFVLKCGTLTEPDLVLGSQDRRWREFMAAVALGFFPKHRDDNQHT
jgi:hypothetical protein